MPRKFRDVEVTPLRDGKAVLIEGAYLPPDQGWIAAVKRGPANELFIGLRTREKPFATFCNANLTFNRFLEKLTATRNEASDAALKDIAHERGESLYETSRTPWAKIRGGKSSLAALPNCPEVVTVDVETPTLAHGAELYSFKMLFASVPHGLPYILASPESLAAVARGVSAISVDGAEGNRGRKRPRTDREVFDYPEIWWRPQQTAAVVTYRNADGKTRHHQVQLATNVDGDVDPAEKRNVTTELHEFYIQNHNGPTIEDGELEDAEDDDEPRF